MPNGTKQRITASRYKSYLKCPRCHQYEYEVGLRPEREPQPLRFGSAFHEGLDQLAKGVSLEDVLTWVAENYSELPEWCQTDELIEAWFVEAEMCSRLLAGYHWRWSNSDVRIVATERSFQLPLRNPTTGAESRLFDLAGKIDKVAWWDGRLVVMEHKTTGDSLDSDSDYWPRLRLDQQISIYMIAARKLGYAVESVLYDVVRKPAIRPRKLTKADRTTWQDEGTYYGEEFGYDPTRLTESPSMWGARLTQTLYADHERYFARQEIPRDERELAETESELWHMQKMIRESQRGGHWPKNSDSCLNPYPCQYRHLCYTGVDVSNGDVPDGFVRIEDVHPELA